MARLGYVFRTVLWWTLLGALSGLFFLGAFFGTIALVGRFL